MKEHDTRRRIFGILLIISLILIDQLAKSLALIKLKDHDPIVILDGVLELRYLENRGAAFSMLQGQMALFYILTVVIVTAALFFYFKSPMTSRYRWFRINMILLISGGVGNFIDRLSRAYVIDFIYFKLIDFPIFNIADIYVTCAEILLIFLVLFYYKNDELEVLWHGRK